MLDYQPFPYQGSKRKIAKKILEFIPTRLNLRLVEPFAGSAAVSIATATQLKTILFWINDTNKPLMRLWKEIILNPEGLSKKYKKLWLEQRGNEREFYDIIRNKFNKTQEPHYLLYLLARCVKASIRYNHDGNFNQGPDNRRIGMRPETMKQNLLIISRLLKNRVKLTAMDYKELLRKLDKDCLVYMDPPYQGVCTNRDSRYIKGIIFSEFVEQLCLLNKKNIPYIVSYDGRTGDKSYGEKLPKWLNLKCLEINAGTSTQHSLLGEKATTYESLYLSPALMKMLERKNIFSEQKKLISCEHHD